MGDWLDEGESGRALDVVAMLDSEAGKLLHEAVAAGALVSLSTTSDGGALGVTVTVDGRYRRQYFRNSDDLELWLSTGLPDISAAAEAARAARASGASRRRLRPT